MRLYVVCHHCGHRIYLRSAARVRSEIAHSFQLTCPFCPSRVGEVYFNTEVLAEMTAVTGAGAAIVSGAIGFVVAGPIGGLVGALGGGTIAAGIEQNDRIAVERFNQS